MASRFTELVIDSHDPERLAAFWQEVLGCPTMERGSDGGPYVWIGGGGSPSNSSSSPSLKRKR